VATTDATVKPVVVSATPVPDDVESRVPDELYQLMLSVTVRDVAAAWDFIWNAYDRPAVTAMPLVPVAVAALNAAAVDAVRVIEYRPESDFAVLVPRVQFVPVQPVVMPPSKVPYLRRLVRTVTDKRHLQTGA
jgi:hypothetical protein